MSVDSRNQAVFALVVAEPEVAGVESGTDAADTENFVGDLDSAGLAGDD